MMSTPVAGSAQPALTAAHLRSTTHARQRGFLRPRLRPGPQDKRKRQRNRLDDEETFAKRDRHVQRLTTAEAAADATDGLAEGERWSTWDQSTPTERGPRPHPRWLVTDLAAIDTELGIVKTGKEADVFLLRRARAGDR